MKQLIATLKRIYHDCLSLFRWIVTDCNGFLPISDAVFFFWMVFIIRVLAWSVALFLGLLLSFKGIDFDWSVLFSGKGEKYFKKKSYPNFWMHQITRKLQRNPQNFYFYNLSLWMEVIKEHYLLIGKWLFNVARR